MSKPPIGSIPSVTNDENLITPPDTDSDFSTPRSPDSLKLLSEASDLAQQLFNQLHHIHTLTPDERAQKEQLLEAANLHLHELQNNPTNG